QVMPSARLTAGIHVGTPSRGERRMTGQAVVQTDGTTPERTAAWQPVTGAGVPGFRLVIGVDGDQRAWVPVGNAVLDRIAGGGVGAGSRVPPVTSLGMECLLASGTAARAFHALARGGVLDWVPRGGYSVPSTLT